MKVRVSLPGEDIQFLDEYVRTGRLKSRSAALQRAVRLLRSAELAASYESAWAEWEARDDADAWEPTTGDGIGRSSGAGTSIEPGR